MKLSTSFAVLLASVAGSVEAASHAKSKTASSWYAGWLAKPDEFPPSAVSWSKYTDVTYSFAQTQADGSISLEGSEPEMLPVFVAEAKKHGVMALTSVGGWTGSRFFSTSVGSAQNRTAFVKTCLDFAKQYMLDGLDFDWEYPNAAGIGCNTNNPADLENFLSFLQELRADPYGKKLFISAAGSLFPWKDSSGNATKDMSGFAKVLDRLAIMNYDIWGPWSVTGGPNSPLRNACDKRSTAGSAEAAVAAYTAAGIPASKIALGVAGYGHGFPVAKENATDTDGKLNMFPVFDSSKHPLGDRFDEANPGPDVCGAAQNPSGVFTFRGLVEEGFLDNGGQPAQGIVSGFDACSQTPAVYNASRDGGVWVSYDDARSFAAKGKFIKDGGLAGFAMWSTVGDYNDILVNSISGAMGI